MNTSTVIEESTGGSLTDGKAPAGRLDAVPKANGRPRVKATSITVEVAT